MRIGEGIEWEKAYLLHDNSQDQTGIDQCFLGNLEDGVVEGALLLTSVVDGHGGLLVELEHVVVVHPLVERGEVLLDSAIADVVVLVGEAGTTEGQRRLVPLETITADLRSDSAESAGLNLGETNGDLRALAGVGAGESGSNRAGNGKSQERSDSENLEAVS